MPISAKEYREHLYAHRNHPHNPTAYSAPANFSGLYWTVVPFLMAEYFAELRLETMPSGIVFPTAYLLFWAFYYTYYRPGSLESKLTSPNKWDLHGLPTVLVGTCVWFVKVAVVEFTEFMISQVLPKKKPQVKRPHIYREQTRRAQSETREQAAPPPPPTIPKEVENALAIMGLQGCRDWRTVQKRYRDLAKKFHPDLNQEITSAGNRFMIYDGAYRRLCTVKEKYFS